MTNKPKASAFYRIFSMGCISLTAVLTLFVFQAVLGGGWTWTAEVSEGMARHLPQMTAEFLPVPVAFLVWARLMERDAPFALRFSPLCCALAVEGFVAALAIKDFPDTQQIAFAFGLVAGLFVLVPFDECRRRAILAPRPALAAFLAGTAAVGYYLLMRTMWAFMCEWTTKTVYAILHGFGMQALAYVDPRRVDSFFIRSPWFSVRINPGCNGLEGIFLFSFMLSVMLLVDWKLFKNCSLLLLYGFGAVYMFFVNALRIAAFFMLGYWANRPGVPAWVQSLRGAPVYLFHSYVGWVFYLIAFGLVAGWLYRSASRSRHFLPPLAGEGGA